MLEYETVGLKVIHNGTVGWLEQGEQHGGMQHVKVAQL